MVKKICIFMVIIALIVSIVPVKTYATIFDPLINFEGYDPGTPSEETEVMNVVNTILGIIQAIGSIIAVGALMIIGIKYMVGSLEEKAQYKEVMMPYIIGSILLFTGVNLLKIIYDFVTKM